MKKIMSLMLGLSLILGVATLAFGKDEKMGTTTTKTKKSKHHSTASTTATTK